MQEVLSPVVVCGCQPPERGRELGGSRDHGHRCEWHRRPDSSDEEMQAIQEIDKDDDDDNDDYGFNADFE